MNNRIKNEAMILLARGTELADVVVFLKKEGVTITETMKTLMEVSGMTLGEAKSFVSSQPCWSGVVKSADTLHDELLGKLTGDEKL